MRIFHVSADSCLSVVTPRLQADFDAFTPGVFAVDEEHLFAFLVPADCPRVCYTHEAQTSEADRMRFFSSPSHTKAMVIEDGWFSLIRDAELWLYECDPSAFTPIGSAQGVYRSDEAVTPIAKYQVGDCFSELFMRDVELRVVNNLRAIAEDVERSTLGRLALCINNAREGDTSWF